eukprot:s56_g29.t1
MVIAWTTILAKFFQVGLLWPRATTGVLKPDLQMSERVPHPYILQTPDCRCIVLIPVDDILVVGRRSFVVNKLVKCLEKSYEVSTQVLQKHGDQLNFLKGTMALQHDGRLTIQTHHKHMRRLCELLKLNPQLQNKKIPGHSDMDQMDGTPDLDPKQAQTFRTCVGVLLSLAADLPRCQHVVRQLATYSSKPSAKSMVALRHLVAYLACHEDLCMSLNWKGRNVEVFHRHGAKDIEPGESILEVFTHFDWASDRATRGCPLDLAASGCWTTTPSLLQNFVAASVGSKRLSAVAGSVSPADVGTKRLPAARLKSLIAILGLYNLHLGNLEGADDPGRIFSQHQHNVVAVLSTLGLFQMQGCQNPHQFDNRHEVPAWMRVCAPILGLAIFLFFKWISGRHVAHAEQVELDEKPEPSGQTVHDETATTAAVEQTQQIEPTPDSYIALLIERCERRCHGAATRERRDLYGGRVTILNGLRSALTSGHESLKNATMRTFASLSGISDDEGSPHYASINAPTSLTQANRAVNFIASALSAFGGLRIIQLIKNISAAMGSANDIWQLLVNYWPVLLGNTLEWYEFAVYGYLESYMERNFFRGSALATWLGFTATFVARPLGGMFLGILSDSFGRKVAVVITVIGMLAATVGQGLLPTPRGWGEDSFAGQLGLYMLFILRLVQGLCTGGEIGAVSTYVTEVAARRSMGRCVAFISITANLGFMFAREVIWAFQSRIGEEEMLTWGWRWPFLLAFIPGVISVAGRLFCLKETELFEQEHVALLEEDEEVLVKEERNSERKSTRRHLQEFACTHFVEVLIGTGGVISFAVFQYGGLVWVNSFLKKHGAPGNYLMMAGTCSRLLQIILAFPVGWLADLYGTAFVTLAGALVQTAAGLPLFLALEAEPSSVANLFVTYTFGYSLVAVLQFTIYLYCAELFPTAVRTLGVGVSYNIGFGLFGGFAPLLAEASLEWSPYGPGLLLSLAGFVTVVTILSSVHFLETGKVEKLAHIRPRPYLANWADGDVVG